MEKKLRHIEICKLLGGCGYNLSLALHEFKNNKPGPILGLSATIHGDQNLPIEILRQFSLELEKIDFKGKVLILPVANPPALSACTFKNPIDMSNLNRVFPGSEKGTLSEKIANAVVKEYISQADYFIDLHAGGAFATVEYTIIGVNSEELAKMMGQRYLYAGGFHPNSMTFYINQKNKQAAICELGWGGKNNKYYIQQGVKGIKNVMKHLKMINGEPELPKKQYCFKELVRIKAKHGGIFKPNLSIESMHKVFKKDYLLGTTYSPYTFEEIENFYGTFENNIIILLRADICRIESGETVIQIANMDTVKLI